MHIERLMAYAINNGAGFTTASRFVDWCFENFTNAELDNRSAVALWTVFCKMQLEK